MDFAQSQTKINLAKSFAGESQARNRYYFYAEQAEKEEYFYLAKLVREIADNEQAHAKVFFNHILEKCGPVENIDITAGYPFQKAATVENMLFSAQAEQDEFETIYPSFAKTAREEGFDDIASSWELIGAVEKSHHQMFQTMHDRLQAGTLYQSEQPVIWKCAVCGHIHVATQAPPVCPLCKHPGGWVEFKLQ